MNILPDKTLCCGCHACANICPKQCIVMRQDDEGFLYPEIDAATCINCGLCRQVCPQIDKKPLSHQSVAYAAKNRNNHIRLESSSGGVFTLIAEEIIHNGGVVFGAAFDDDFHVKHVCVSSASELEKLRGSKYVQSAIGDTYAQARQYLEAGTPVLFTGTPCQIAGLHSFLRKPYRNLLTQDIICHGVPSPLVWEKYLTHRKAVASASVDSVSFRNKDLGWRKYQLNIHFSSQKTFSASSNEDLFLRCFLSDICLRPSCHNCQHKDIARQSDITLADFWGIEHVAPEFDDNTGTSLVVIHSKQGQELFELIKDKITCKSVDLNTAIQYNSAMICSVKPHKNREKFFQLLRKSGFYAAAKRCLTGTTIHKIKRCVKRIIKLIME